MRKIQTKSRREEGEQYSVSYQINVNMFCEKLFDADFVSVQIGSDNISIDSKTQSNLQKFHTFQTYSCSFYRQCVCKQKFGHHAGGRKLIVHRSPLFNDGS